MKPVLDLRIKFDLHPFSIKASHFIALESVFRVGGVLALDKEGLVYVL